MIMSATVPQQGSACASTDRSWSQCPSREVASSVAVGLFRRLLWAWRPSLARDRVVDCPTTRFDFCSTKPIVDRRWSQHRSRGVSTSVVGGQFLCRRWSLPLLLVVVASVAQLDVLRSEMKRRILRLVPGEVDMHIGNGAPFAALAMDTYTLSLQSGLELPFREPDS